MFFFALNYLVLKWKFLKRAVVRIIDLHSTWTLISFWFKATSHQLATPESITSLSWYIIQKGSERSSAEIPSLPPAQGETHNKSTSLQWETFLVSSRSPSTLPNFRQVVKTVRSHLLLFYFSLFSSTGTRTRLLHFHFYILRFDTTRKSETHFQQGDDS